MLKKHLLIILLPFLCSFAWSQNKYWVYFTDKNEVNINSIPKDQIVDLPVSGHYLDSLKKLGMDAIVVSNWLNAVSVLASVEEIENIKNLGFVSSTELIGRYIVYNQHKPIPETYSSALKQVNGQFLRAIGLNGQGVKIGIIDGGFMGANHELTLDDIFFEDQYKEYKNFTDDQLTAFQGREQLDEDHGTRVWENLGGYDRDKDRIIGLATHSEYYLAKTDRKDLEYRGEEDYWVAAIEWLYQNGVSIVNSSIGYSVNFDDPNENYKPTDIDGKSSAITRAANIASKEKGMLLVVSAGNNGLTDFQVVSVPADAENVLTVGGCSNLHNKKLSFSSIGSELMDYPKPDVCVFHLGGTSFSAPVIAGLAACIKQYNPSFNNFEIMDIIRKASNLYPFANNYVGYGVPDSGKIIELMKNPDAKVWDSKEIKAGLNYLELDAGRATKAVLYHKSNSIIVLEEVELQVQDGKFLISQLNGAKQTTVSFGDEIYEVIWP